MKRKFLVIIAAAVFSIAMCGTAFGAGRSLYNGTSGDDVYELQQLLSAYGYFYDEPTGYFGDLTEQALIDSGESVFPHIFGRRDRRTCYRKLSRTQYL